MPLDDSIEHYTNYRAEGDGVVPVSYRCGACEQESRIVEYLRSGTITNRLSMDAWSCHFYTTEALAGLRAEYRDYFTRHRDTLFAVKQAVDGITTLARQFEVRHWLGMQPGRIQHYYANTKERGHESLVPIPAEGGIQPPHSGCCCGAAPDVCC